MKSLLLVVVTINLIIAGCSGGGNTPVPSPTTEPSSDEAAQQIATSIADSTSPATSVPVKQLWTGNPTVQTSYGDVKAFDDEANTWVWKAIPFAQPPIGNLRWKAPRDPEYWNEIREEKEFCSPCTQYDAYLGTKIIGNEDCLYLNIWRPQSEKTKLPVYVWIHGGGNSNGSAFFNEGYYGASLSSKSDMIFVSVNYRLGPMGWFTHPATRTGDTNDTLDNSGNYGTLDLIKSLQWIQENIEAFGGDPGNVIIAGESAGGLNVLSLLISPLAKGLFHKAISMSGLRRTSTVADGDASANDAILYMLINDAEAEDEVAAKALLDSMSMAEVKTYLSSKTSAEILGAYDSPGFGMITFPDLFRDGTVLPDIGFDTLDTGYYPNKVPIILGSTKDEQKTFLFMNPAFTGDDELYQRTASYMTDLWKADGVDEIAMQLSSHSDQPAVYAYQFLWGSLDETSQSVLPDEWGFRLGAAHSIDIPFFLGSDTGPLGILGLYTEENRVSREALTDAILAYQTEFALTGDPNGLGTKFFEWKPWSNDVDAPKCLLLDADINGNLRMQISAQALTASGIKEESKHNDTP